MTLIRLFYSPTHRSSGFQRSTEDSVLQSCFVEIVGRVFSVCRRSTKQCFLPPLSPCFAVWHLSTSDYFDNSSLWFITDHKAILCPQIEFCKQHSTSLPQKRIQKCLSTPQEQDFYCSLDLCFDTLGSTVCSIVLNSCNFFKFIKSQRKESPTEVMKTHRDVLRKRFHTLLNSHKRIYRKKDILRNVQSL